MTKIGDLPEECIHAVVPVLVKVLDDITPLGGRVGAIPSIFVADHQH